MRRGAVWIRIRPPISGANSEYLHVDEMTTVPVFAEPLHPIYARVVVILVELEVHAVLVALAARRVSYAEDRGVVSWPDRVNQTSRTGLWRILFP